MCYTTSGTTPATAGNGTSCTTGSVYSTAISVSASETLKIIAGTSTLTDSSVVSYSYVINPVSIYGGGAGHSSFGNFAPATYRARYDLSFVPYPGSIPCPSSLGCAGGGAFNGANYQMIPTDFPSTTLVRLSDLATGGQSAVHGGYTTSCDSSSEENKFNINKDRLIICQVGNWPQLWGWNNSTLAGTRDASFVSPGTGSPEFSYTQPYVYYHVHLCPASTSGCTQNDISIFSYDSTCAGGIATCTPPASTVADVATACGISALQANSSGNGGILPSGDDQTFGGGFSSTAGQGSSGDVYAAAWTRAGNCYYWNTATGQTFVNGVLQGTIGISDRFTIHNVKMGKGGTWMKVSLATCNSSCTTGQTNYMWQIGTTTVNVVTSANSCGHTAAGYNFWVNKCSGVTSTNGLFKSTFATPNTNISLPAAYPSGTGDQAHLGWADNNASDTMPIFASMEDTTFSGSSPWDGDLIAIATDGSQRVWQLAHHYVSQINPTAFIPIAPSQDGSLLLFTSDWDQMFGCSDGVTLGCGLNNPDWASGTAYTTTSIITPLLGNTGVSAIGYSYHPQSNCTSGSTEPSPWIQTVNAGSSNDNGGSGGCTWVNAGLARTEVLVAILPKN